MTSVPLGALVNCSLSFGAFTTNLRMPVDSSMLLVQPGIVITSDPVLNLVGIVTDVPQSTNVTLQLACGTLAAATDAGLATLNLTLVIPACDAGTEPSGGSLDFCSPCGSTGFSDGLHPCFSCPTIASSELSVCAGGSISPDAINGT